MIISCTFSKPVKNIEEILGRPYLRIKIKAANTSGTTSYFVESFTEKQAFHEQKDENQLNEFIAKTCRHDIQKLRNPHRIRRNNLSGQ